nr:TonB-dependent receptor [Woeseiaceae bacterium]
AAIDDPDHFSTEGSGAVLRGLPQTRSSFNGRDTFSANSNRGLTFQDVPPELMGAVKIFKNQTADMIEGGISGTIDLVTRKPLDASERQLGFSAQMNYGDMADEWTPSYNGLYSDVWDTENGKLGILLSYANSELDFRSDGVEAGIHNLVTDAAGAGQDRYIPINAGMRTTFTERDREGFAASLQYANDNNGTTALFEYVRSDSRRNWIEHAFFSDDNGGSVAAGAEYDDVRFISGTIENLGSGLGPQTRRQDTEILVEDFSLNLGFQPTDRLSLTADVQFVDAKTTNTDVSVFAGIVPQGGAGINVDMDLGRSIPFVAFHAPTGSAQSDEEFFNDPANYYWRAAMDHLEDSEGDELAFRLDADYELDDAGFARSIEAGVRFAERDQTTRWSTFNWGNLSESWAGGFALFDGTRNGETYGSTAASPFSFDDFHLGDAGGIGGSASATALFADASIVSNYSSFLDGVSPFPFNPLGSRGGLVGGTPYTAPEINKTNEQNTAAYVKLNFGTESPRMDGNIGLRWVEVETSVAGGTQFPVLNANTAAFASPEELAFNDGTQLTEDASSSESHLLPSLNMKFEVTDDVIARFGYSKAIAFPDLGALRYNYNISVRTEDDINGNPDIIGYRQDSGNPFLKPMEADNYDLSFEWYFDEGNYLSAGIFYKSMKNFFATDAIPTEVTNPTTGQSQIVEINQPINIGNASLRGFELSYQQFFDDLPGAWSGLGMQFNFTYLSESGVPQQNVRPVQASGSLGDRTTVPFTGLPLQGLSERSYNLVGIFQNDLVEARLAYNWRDDYLLTIRQVNLGLPVFADARGQLDGSAFFNINDNWQIGVQATNLLQDDLPTSMQVNQAGDRVFRSTFVFDTRYSVVARGKF